MASVTLYLSGSYSPAANNFTVYCNTAAPGNAIATGVSQATLANGWCTDTVCSAYVVQSNTEECSYSYYVTVAGIPTPTPTATGTINPTATPTPTTTGPTPTPTQTGPTPTPTPTPTASATPTPTPTPTGIVYELFRSVGSVNQNQCAAEVSASIYTNVPIPLWTGSSARVFTDETLSVGFN